MKVFRLISLFVLMFALQLSVLSQTDPAKDVLSVTGDKFSFKYPSNWKVTDKSSQALQQFNLIPDKGNALIMVMAFPSKISSYEAFEIMKVGNSYPFIEKILQGFSNSVRTEECIEINGAVVPGFRVSGVYSQKPSKGDIFLFALKEKYFQLIYMRNDEDSAKTDTAWKTIVESLNVDGKDGDLLIDFKNDAVLNGKAIKLPRPMYPSGVKGVAPTEVRVRVTIDENGNVISAKALTGDYRFHPLTIDAAKRAKFAPSTICGKPTKITGIITYNFVR